jgi:hypothetical protein
LRVGYDNRLYAPHACASNADGSILFVLDTGCSQPATCQKRASVRKVVVASREVTTIAGGLHSWTTQDGVGTNAGFNQPKGLAITPDATTAYVAEYTGHRIRQVDIASGTVTTIAGTNRGDSDGIGTNAEFNHPSGLAMSQAGLLYMADYLNNRIRRFEVATRLVSTRQPSCDALPHWQPRSLALYGRQF